MFERKDEVIIKHSCLKYYKDMKNLTKKDGRKKVSKTGRVISLEGEFLQIDFWDSSPSKFSVKVEHVELLNKSTEEDRAVKGLGSIVTKNQAKALLYNEAAASFDEDHVAVELPKLSREEFGSLPCFLDDDSERKVEYKVESEAKVFKLEHDLSLTRIPDIPEITDFGNSNTSTTGSMRFNTGKIDPTHLAPDFVLAMAEVLTKNEHKYTKYNYAKGQAYSTSTASMFRHMLDFMNGVDIDPTDECDMLAKIAVNAMITWCTKKYHLEDNPELDDRFKTILGV